MIFTCLARRVVVLLLSLAFATNAVAAPTWSAFGGDAQWRFYRQALSNLGLQLVADDVVERGPHLDLSRPVSSLTSIEFESGAAKFQRLVGGSISLAGGFLLSSGAQSFDLNHGRLVPLDNTTEASLALRDAAGRHLMTLRYGHYDFTPRGDGGTLDVWIMDAFLGPDLASALGLNVPGPVLLGQVSLHLDAVAPPGMNIKGGTAPNVPAPNWPNTGGFEADLELQRMDQIVETATLRTGNRIAITPSAYFENIGSADLPWYSMFTIPAPAGQARDEAAGEDEDCINDGFGQCQPYGVDQGGLLVWNLYRLVDDRFEQLARSGVKHAWNSINIGCAAASGRIVGTGCADRYSAGNNADQSVLGPRSEIQAAAVIWQKQNSIWDGDGDGDCDDPNTLGFPHDKSWCLNSPADDMVNRLSVDASALQTAGARYFLEAWYLVRDDINIFNSMGYQEIRPEPPSSGGGMWSFPCSGGPCSSTFVNGPALSAWIDPSLPGPDATSATYDAQEGRVRLASRVIEVGESYRYQMALMNFDFDRRLDSITVPLPPGVLVSNTNFHDGDSNPGNDWTVLISSSSLTWNAPAGGDLDWGSLVSFSYESSASPTTLDATVGVEETGAPSTLSLSVRAPVDRLFQDGFED